MPNPTQSSYGVRLAVLLWVATGALNLLAAVDPASAVEDIARRGDVIALMALATTSAIAFSAWLVRQYVTTVRENVQAVSKIASDMAGVSEEMKELVDEMRRRPCVARQMENDLR